MATVVRVKRKRHADPPVALLLASKKIKNDEHFKGKSGMADVIKIEENVFRFATTVASSGMDESVKDKVKSVMKEHKKTNSIYHLQPIAGIKRTFDARKLKPEHERYKLVRKEDELARKSTENSAKVGRPVVCRARSCCDDKTVSCFSSVLDVVEKEAVSPSKPDDIICNSVKMFREKLCLPEPYAANDEYVYDLYYCEQTQRDWNVKDILYVQPCRDLNLCYDVKETPKNYFEDEDDSNDEDNWRNDYPDEDDSVDENDRRLIFDEEEDRYESDDFDALGRDNSDDNCGLFLGNSDVVERNYDDEIQDLDYGDELDYGDDLNFHAECYADEFDEKAFDGESSEHDDFF